MEEEELIERLRQRDRAAYEYAYKAYKAYKDVVFRAVYKYVPLMEDAEEVVQDVFVKAFKKIDQFNRLSRVSTWMIRIAINTAKNFRDSISRQQEVIQKQIDIMNEDTWVADTPDPEMIALQKDGKRLLKKAFSKLSPDQNTACTLFYVQGLQQIDIAEIMDTSLDAVQSLIHRGKVKLRDILQNHKYKIFI